MYTNMVWDALQHVGIHMHPHSFTDGVFREAFFTCGEPLVPCSSLSRPRCAYLGRTWYSEMPSPLRENIRVQSSITMASPAGTFTPKKRRTNWRGVAGTGLTQVGTCSMSPPVFGEWPNGVLSRSRSRASEKSLPARSPSFKLRRAYSLPFERTMPTRSPESEATGSAPART